MLRRVVTSSSSLSSSKRLGFIRHAAPDGILWGRIYDAHIAESARLAGADLVVTENRRHFLQLLRHGLRVPTSAELIEELGE